MPGKKASNVNCYRILVYQLSIAKSPELNHSKRKSMSCTKRPGKESLKCYQIQNLLNQSKLNLIPSNTTEKRALNVIRCRIYPPIYLHQIPVLA